VRRRESAAVTPFTIWRRRVVRALFGVVLVIAGYLGVTFVMYVTNPTYGVSFAARAAEWGRDHGLGWFVSEAERIQYDLNPPKVGGKPPANAFGKGSTSPVHAEPGHLTPPVRMASPAGKPLPGEGVFHPVGRRLADGAAGIYVAYVRPDAQHTSYVAGVAWMDPTVLSTTLYSGSYIPGGGPYTHQSPVSAGATRYLDAIFNSGFRMNNANGGYYTDGKVILPLRKGAASAVIYKDGQMTVGAWGTQLTMTNQVVAVRQNLDLLVNDAKPVPGLNSNDAYVWGATLGGGAYVWRSGLGVTKSGALVYVAGSTLSITSLAHILQLAGCVRAMELDINPDWVQYSIFHGKTGTVLNGADATKLLTSMIGPPARYFESWWQRDFFVMTLRTTPLSPQSLH
jgi:hypothetical protein